METFYKNPKTKLWDEEVSAEQIVTNTEWDFGLTLGELQKRRRYSYFINALQVAIFRLRATGYTIQETANALNKPKWFIKKYL